VLFRSTPAEKVSAIIADELAIGVINHKTTAVRIIIVPGSKAGEPDTFYGYYTIEFEKDGRTLGMLSVDGYYGQIWYHSWHGAYLSEKQF